MSCRELACLAREAQFFGLPGLLERINGTAIVPEPNTRAVYDSIYLETGFSSIEGPNIKEMEQRKVCDQRSLHILRMSPKESPSVRTSA
jgi:hypothetical protein